MENLIELSLSYLLVLETLKVEKFLSECKRDATRDDFLSKLTTILELGLLNSDLDPATKTVIRILARKAKAMNRVDVFERLRKVVPAGTTGKSVKLNNF